MNLSGLYAITPESLSGPELHQAVSAAMQGGASVVQYRRKDRTHPQYYSDAGALHEIVDGGNGLYIINDDVELATRIGAHGVHVGAHDTPVATVRDKGSAGWIIGMSCYNSLEAATAAEAAGADYVAFGSFYPSPTKPGAIRASLKTLTEARATLRVPIVAIGGIDSTNAPALIEAGADAVAVITDLFEQADVASAAGRLAALFN